MQDAVNRHRSGLWRLSKSDRIRSQSERGALSVNIGSYSTDKPAEWQAIPPAGRLRTPGAAFSEWATIRPGLSVNTTPLGRIWPLVTRQLPDAP